MTRILIRGLLEDLVCKRCGGADCGCASCCPKDDTVDAMKYAFGWTDTRAILGTRPRRFGVLFRWLNLWLGAHYSRHHRRWCINLIPCVTIWFTLRGGNPP